MKIQESCKLLRFTAKEVSENQNDLKGGSATSLVSVVDKKTGMIDICLVGDSSLLVFRKDSIVFNAGITKHHFNAPYQISLNTKTKNPLVYNPSTRYTSKIQHQKFQLQPGDIIVSATDGLFDNVFDSQIIAEIQNELKAVAISNYDCLSNERSLKNLADSISFNLMSTAEIYATKRNYKSPFQVEAEKYGKKKIKGGKPDDTTVVVTIVCNNKRN